MKNLIRKMIECRDSGDWLEEVLLGLFVAVLIGLYVNPNIYLLILVFVLTTLVVRAIIILIFRNANNDE